MPLIYPDWSLLENLRARFLKENFEGDYWRSRDELLNYDATFAQRIAWKWDYVLEELQRIGWKLPGRRVLDWGCGSGVAGRAVQRYFNDTEISYFDQSPLAQGFAIERLPGSQAWVRETPVDVLVLSHVLNELSADQSEKLQSLISQVRAVIFVEPGTTFAGRKLPGLRDKLFAQGFRAVAPCTHQKRCPLNVEPKSSHWCHHFAPVPSEVFQDAQWAEFAKQLKIDINTLPLAYLVLERERPVPDVTDHSRIIGEPRAYKAYCKILSCDKLGLRDLTLQKRDDPELFKSLRKSTGSTLVKWVASDVDDEKVLSGKMK